MTDTEKSQQYLNTISSFQLTFDNITFISAEGKLIAESSYLPGRRGSNFSYREWFQKTVATRKPYISNPFISIHTPVHPAIIMTVPLFDSRMKMTGMLTGSIDLSGKNFLADLSKVIIGKAGYLYITDSNRVMIVHPDKSRIMKVAGFPGGNKLYDRALNGFEGSGEAVNTKGVAMLISYKHLTMTSWILAANYPASEAYAPLYKAEHYFRITAAAATVLLLLITWLIMKRLMSPLITMTGHVKDLPGKPRQDHHIASDSADEIGVLATAFNAMIDTLDRQQDSLESQKNRIEDERILLQTIMDAIPDLIIYKDCNSIYQRCNDSFASLLVGQPKEIITGCCDYDFAATAELAEDLRQSDQDVISGGNPCKRDVWIKLVDGSQILVETVKVPLHDSSGSVKGVIAISRDITERKRAEDKHHEQAQLLEQEMAERQAAQESLEVKQLQLEAINQTLEERVLTAVRELRRKDQMLIQQSRLAVMGEMINNIAHQWRQPLNNIGLIVQALEMDIQSGNMDENELRQEIEKVMSIISFMSNTIDDFRNFFRHDKQKRRFNVKRAVAGVLEFISANLKSSNIAIELSTEENAFATGYRNEYTQVLLNILSNARDVLLERKIRNPCIRLNLCCDQDRSILIISDNGGGVPDDVLPHIFDPYFTTKGPDKGTGIGLYMSKVIIEQNMNGRLTACNSEEGAEFKIEV